LLAIASLAFYYSSQNKSIYSDELISNVSLDFKNNLKLFLGKADKTSSEIMHGTVGSNNDTLTHTELNEVFTKQIKNDNLLKGVLLFSEKINYVIVREDKTWATTYSTAKSDSMLDWTRLNENLQEISHWSDTYNFFMNDKNKKIISNNLNKNGESIWRVVKSEIPDKRELFVNIFEITDVKNQKYIIGLLYKISDVGKNFSKIFMFENPLVNIINEKGELITPIKTTDTSKISTYKKLSTEVENILKNWRENRNNQPYSYSFEKKEQIYWTHIDTLDHASLKGFVITVSENDILQTNKYLRLIYLYLSISFFILGSIILIFSIRKKKNNNYEITPLVKHDLKTVNNIIKAGETEHVEFKSSLRFDYRLEKENKILEEVILKSIAAFANAKGGTLLIGVDDDLNVLGLENDYSTLKKNDADYFELHLRKLINNQFGITFANESLLIYFPVIEKKQICVIQINSSSAPLFLKTKDKQGQPTEKFYVRSGNASQQIVSLKEINEFTRRRFGRRYKY
jgi:hypothetical protein